MTKLRVKARYLSTLTLTGIALLAFSGCSAGSEVRLTQGNEQIGTAPTGTIIQTNSARIVHVDVNERLATIRNGGAFDAGIFLQTSNNSGKTSLLKVEPKRPDALTTAYILEGEPFINDEAKPVSKQAQERLIKLYP